MSAAVISIIVAAGLTISLAQNNLPTAPPASPLGQPAPTSTVPQGGATINAATGQPVAPSTAAGQAAATNAARATGVQTNALPARSGQAGTNAVASGRSNITPAQLQNINRLAIDLNALGLATRDPVEQRRGLLENLNAAPISPVRPSPESIARLGESVAAVIPSLTLTAPQRRQLAIDINLALNSGNLTPVESQRVIADARNVLQRSAAQNPDGVERLLSALAGVVAEVQSSMAQSAPQPDADAAAGNAGEATPDPAAAPVPTEAGQGGGSQTGQSSGGSPSPPQR